MSVTVSVVINAHREGALLAPTISSVIQSAEKAKMAGISCKINLVLDAADQATRDAARLFKHDINIHEVEFKDLSLSRRHGLSLVDAEFTTFIDGDDLWGADWIVNCCKTCRKLDDSKVVVHPRVNMYFGRGLTPHFWIHPDMREIDMNVLDVVVQNRWTALSFAPSEIYRKYTYQENRIVDGFGYEDWLWHIETIKAGVRHIVAKDTIHFIRRKSAGSLLGMSKANHVLPRLYDRDWLF